MSPEAVRQWLVASLGRPVELVFTNNRSTMMSCREGSGGYRIRLHRFFLRAPAQVWEALVAYVGDDDVNAGRFLDEYVSHVCASLPRAPIKLRPAGRVHHLGEILTELNHRYFHGSCQARITWGKAGARRRRRSIQLGCYVPEDQLIRIHPSLDQSFVPRHYVAWVVYHEMLHEVFGVPQRGGPRSVHPPEFVAMEETYPDYERCLRWEEENLNRLLRYRAPQKRR